MMGILLLISADTKLVFDFKILKFVLQLFEFSNLIKQDVISHNITS